MKNCNQKNHISLIIFMMILISILFLGCTETGNNSDGDQEPDKTNSTERFYGEWTGTETKNQIALDITFHTNNTGMFQGIDITWNLNDSILELGMFGGESPSYYEYHFSNNYTTLKLTNIYSDEIFELTKK